MANENNTTDNTQATNSDVAATPAPQTPAAKQAKEAKADPARNYIYTGAVSCTMEENGQEIKLYHGAELSFSGESKLEQRLKAQGKLQAK